MRTTLLGARIGFHETQLPRSERELLAVFFDELGATVTEGDRDLCMGSAEGAGMVRPDRPALASVPLNESPSVTIVQSSLFDNKEAA